jgi:hypothetical protein
MFSNHVYKIIILPTLVIIIIPNLEIFLFCQHNSTGGGNFELRQTISTVAAVEISDRKDLNTLYKFRNLISVNRIFIKDYKVSVSI